MSNWRIWRKENILVYLMPIEQAGFCPERSCFNGDDNGDGPGENTTCPPVGQTTLYDIGFRDRCGHMALPPLLTLGGKWAIRPPEEGMQATERLLQRMGFEFGGVVEPPPR